LNTTTRLLLTVEESAQALRLSRTHVYDLLARGELASVKIGRARRIPAQALDEYVDRLRADAARTADGR
jgi:excisionase family DNA binding protein